MSASEPQAGCQRFEDVYDLYVLGSLEEVEARALAEHLLTGCHHCRMELEGAIGRAQVVSESVPLVDPPARLRRRLAAAIGEPGETRLRWPRWLPAAAVAACLVLMAIGWWQVQKRRSESFAASSDLPRAARLASMLEILAAPGTVEVPLSTGGNQALHGTLYVHKNLGMAMVISKLPAPPAGWVYESWVLPKGSAPRPIESFDANAGGSAVSVLRGPVDIQTFEGVAISMEPIGTTPSKPTTLVFNGGVKTSG